MKEYIELLEKMSEEISKNWKISKEDVMKIIRKYLNPFEEKPKDRFNPMLN